MYISKSKKNQETPKVHPSKLGLEPLIYPVHIPGGSFAPLVSKKRKELANSLVSKYKTLKCPMMENGRASVAVLCFQTSTKLLLDHDVCLYPVPCK
jgi:hypothetical protein